LFVGRTIDQFAQVGLGLRELRASVGNLGGLFFVDRG
jgi:hypothetical protein